MKTKRLFTFIVAVMMIFGVISPVSAETVTVETPIGNYDKTFNTYADFAALKAADSKWTIPSGSVTLEAEAGNESNKAIKYTNVGTTFAKSKYMFESPVSSGTLKISFKTKGLARRFCPTVFGSDETKQSYLGRIMDSNSAVCVGSWGTPSDLSQGYNATIDKDKWYTWEVTINLDASTIMKDVDLKDPDGNVIARRRNQKIIWGADSGTYTTITGFGITNGDGSNAENTEVYLDDLSISHLTTKEYINTGAYGTYDTSFDSYADFAALKAADSKWTIAGGAVTLEAEAGNESNKAIKYTNVDKTYAKSKYMFASPISSGILKISFKTKGLAVRFCPTLIGTDVKGNTNKMTYLGRISSTSSAVCAGSWGDPSDTSLTHNAKIDQNKWYTWEVTVDLDAATVTKDVDIKDSEGTVIASRRKYSIMNAADTSAKFASFTGFGIMNGDNVIENTEVYLDDLVIEVTLPAPKVTASSVTLENVSGETVAGLTNISPDIKKINIDFGIDVDDATISADTVKLVKDGETDGVSYKGKYADNVYTMVLDEILDGSSTYNLFVSKDITNMQRTGMESDANIGITTAKARFDATINSIVINDAEVENIAGLTPGESATINIGYSNLTKTEKSVCVIVAYYDGNLLVGADYKKLSVSATDYTGTFDVTHTVLSTTDVDLVKVMVWDGLGTMRSLTTSYPVSAQ